MPSTEKARLDEFRRRLAQLHIGTVKVIDAYVEPQFDHEGAPYLQVTLVLADPAPPDTIWSMEDTFQLRQEVRLLAEQWELAQDVRITVTSQGDDDAEDAL